jgi:hypothetical protein
MTCKLHWHPHFRKLRGGPLRRRVHPAARIVRRCQDRGLGALGEAGPVAIPRVEERKEGRRMIPVQAHLFLNHVPIVGLMFGLVFLVIGMRRSSAPTFLTGLRILVAIGLITVLVAVSGLVSASRLEGVAWLDASAVSKHQFAGILTLAVHLSVATASAFVLFESSRTGGAVTPRVRKAVVALAVGALGMGLWTAELGGTIRHTELGDPAHQGQTSNRDVRVHGDKRAR